jgi:hypothetical protein
MASTLFTFICPCNKETTKLVAKEGILLGAYLQVNIIMINYSLSMSHFLRRMALIETYSGSRCLSEYLFCV